MAVSALLALLAVLHAMPARGNGVNLPGAPNSVEAPDGRFVVLCVGPRIKELISEGTPTYDLALRNIATGDQHVLATFQRSVDVLWSPDSRNLAVTFWFGSNVAFVKVFTVGKSIRELDVDGLVYRRFGPLSFVSTSDHVYWNALCWSGSDAVFLQVFGHGRLFPTGFSKCFLVWLDGRAETLPTCEPGEQSW